MDFEKLKKPLESTVLQEVDGEIVLVSVELINPIFIYVLFKDGIPIYVGQTKDVEKRISQHHKLTKRSFDTYSVICHFYDREKATTAERAVISALRLLNFELQNKVTMGYSFSFANVLK